MTEDRNAPRMHPDDLAALVRSLEHGPIRLPPPPSEVPTGIDARVISDVVRAMIAERVGVFLTGDQIDKLIGERLARIGLQTDDDHIEQTGDAIRSAMKWHKRLDKVIAGISITIITAIIYAVLKLVGINLPAPGNG